MSGERLTNKERIEALEEAVSKLIERLDAHGREQSMGRDPMSVPGCTTERRGTYDADRVFGFGVRMEAK